MTTIVRDDDIRSGSPRIEGTRITVLDLKRRVIDNEEDPHVVAGEYEISMQALFHGLAYYYEHRDELETRERAGAQARSEGEQATRELLERATRSDAESSEQVD